MTGSSAGRRSRRVSLCCVNRDAAQKKQAGLGWAELWGTRHAVVYEFTSQAAQRELPKHGFLPTSSTYFWSQAARPLCGTLLLWV